MEFCRKAGGFGSVEKLVGSVLWKSWLVRLCRKAGGFVALTFLINSSLA